MLLAGIQAGVEHLTPAKPLSKNGMAIEGIVPRPFLPPAATRVWPELCGSMKK